MKIRRVYLGMCISIFVISCHEPSQKKVTVNDRDSLLDSGVKSHKIIYSKIDSIKIGKGQRDLTCDELIVQLIKESTFDSQMKKLITGARVDRVTANKISIEILSTNEERHEDVPLSWIDLDRTKKELKDVTIDPSNPINLKYDTALFDKVISHCVVPE